MLLYFLYTIHVLTCIFLILVVLLQRGKGADLSVFGGGSTQAAFGARGTATLLHKLTVGFFVAFIVTTLSIAMVQGRTHGTTVFSGEEAAATEETATPAGEAGGTEEASATGEAGAETAGDSADTLGAGDAAPALEAAGSSTESTSEAPADGAPEGSEESP